MAKKYIIVQTHTNKKQISEKIAKMLLERKLALCINIYPHAISLYKYNNKIIEDNEYLIHAKTESNNFEEIKNLIEELHNYETPEIISLKIYQGNEKYLKWLRDETG